MTSRHIGMSWFCGGSAGSFACWDDPSTSYLSETEIADVIKRNRTIEEQIDKDRMLAKKIMKILLLGGPESGKSTIFKQMRILHMNGFSDMDLINYRYLIYSNVIQSIYQLLEGAKALRIDINATASVEVEKFLEYYRQTPQYEVEISGELGYIIKKIFNSPFMQKVLLKQHEIELLDSAVYFLDNINRIAEQDYMPNLQDILRSRVQTTGIVEMEFDYKGFKLR
uniref:Uncharacterized protein n=1 Tax=Acrobeloides nanus TaxID=290746 RepID=A0A914EQ55_9BILA